MEELTTTDTELRWGIVLFQLQLQYLGLHKSFSVFIRNYCYGGRNFVKRLPLKKIEKP